MYKGSNYIVQSNDDQEVTNKRYLFFFCFIFKNLFEEKNFNNARVLLLKELNAKGTSVSHKIKKDRWNTPFRLSELMSISAI